MTDPIDAIRARAEKVNEVDWTGHLVADIDRLIKAHKILFGFVQNVKDQGCDLETECLACAAKDTLTEVDRLLASKEIKKLAQWLTKVSEYLEDK